MQSIMNSPVQDEKLDELAGQLARQKSENVLLRRRIGLNASIDQWLREIENRSALSTPELAGDPGEAAAGITGKAIWDVDQDCRFANQDSRFDRVCHVFHQEWFGIRAAAGSLPGHKLAISAAASWSSGDLKAIGERLEELGIRAMVVHGMSAAMQQLVEVLKKLGGTELYLVWHGSTTQWANKDELELSAVVLDLNKRGVFKRMHSIRCGMDQLFGDNAFVPQLLNMPPLVASQRFLPRKQSDITVLCPSWNNLYKNLYTNILAGALSGSVARVLAFAQNLQLPSSLGAKLNVLPPRTQAATIELMGTVDMVANVTVIDCHPMVNLEALAVGTPTLEGPLFLDSLEDHPYKTLVRVENAMSMSDIQAAMEKLLSVPGQELNQMMDDYRLQLTELSRQRYLQFLEASL
jgi:hypothetical protein